MKITTKAVYDIATWELLEWEGYEYSGPIEEVKGGASKAEQSAADSMRQQELGLMQQQLQMQMGQLNSVNPVLDRIIANGGMNPEQEAAMRAMAMNQTARNFQDTAGMVNQNLVARGLTGGQNAGGGGVASQFGQLGAMQNALQANSMNSIQMAKGQGLMQALMGKLGIASSYGQNIGTFNQGASSALQSGVTAANNVDQAGMGLWGSIIGGGLGLAGSMTGKGGMFGK